MPVNPYKYGGPLDPEEDAWVCVPRSEEIKKIRTGLMRGEYWAILGPRRIGKTTLLRQVKSKYRNVYFIDCDFQIKAPVEKEKFYPWLMDECISEVPSARGKKADYKNNLTPELNFMAFLSEFLIEEDSNRIVFLFDEIDNIPFLEDFLRFWRGVFHERYHKKALRRYNVIVAGAVDLIEVTIGPTSPFNIAELLYLKDFTDEESEVLIDGPLERLGIRINREAKRQLMSRISGHPQMLQQACHILVDSVMTSKKTISGKDVETVFETLYASSQALDTLRVDITENKKLQQLVKAIIRGEKKKFFPNKKFSMLGAGAITEQDTFCSIRNEVFKEFIGILFEYEGDSGKIPTQSDISKKVRAT